MHPNLQPAPNSPLKILLRMPNWLGDSVMVSPSFELLKAHFPDASFVLVGSKVACEIYARDSRVERIFIDTTKAQKNRFKATLELAKNIGRCDLAVTFSNSFFSALFLWATKTPVRVGYAWNFRLFFLTQRPPFVRKIHQVISYFNLVANLCGTNIVRESGANAQFCGESGGEIFGESKCESSRESPCESAPKSPQNPQEIPPLRLIAHKIRHFPKDESRRYIGINAGAAYGEAKKWEAVYFVEIIAQFLAQNCVVVLFGNADDSGLCELQKLLEKYPQKSGNLLNLIGKTTIAELCDYIALLDLFITNDSGPMHIAAAFNVPIIAMFGATDPRETAPWRANAKILSANLPCAPCKKRACPLKHHNCMKLLSPDLVLENAYKILH